MKKVILAVISLTAIGAGIYLYQKLKEQKIAPTAASKEELLKNVWKVSSQTPVHDTVVPLYYYSFENKGLMTRYINDSARKDTALYTWTSGERLSWQFAKNDSILYVYKVRLLNADSLVLQSPDSVTTFILCKVPAAQSK